MRPNRSLPALALSALLAACGLTVTGVGPNNDAGTSPEPDAAFLPAEASILGDAGDAETPDADAAPEADAGDAGSTDFCAGLTTAFTFCDDFDTAPDAAAGWGGMLGNPKRTTTTWKSAPGALDGSGGTSALLTKAFVVHTSLTVDLDARFVSLPGNPGAIGPIILSPSSGDGYLYFFADATHSYVQISTDQYATGQTPPPTTGMWHHITLSGAIGGSGTVFAGSLDGVPYRGFPANPHPWSNPVTVTVEVGANVYSTSGEVFVDNVVVVAQ